MLPGEAVESPSMDIVKTELDMVLDSLFQLDLLEWGIGLGGFKKFLLPPKSSVILCWWTFFVLSMVHQPDL